MGIRVARWGEYRTDWPRYRCLVTVSAAPSINWAGIHAGAAANAVERATKIIAPQNLTAPIVDQHNMQFTPFARAMKM